MQKIRLYTDTIDPELASLVRLIPHPEDCTAFDTAWTGDPQDTQGGKLPPLTRLHAWRYPGRDTWNINRLTRVVPPGQETPVINIEQKILVDVCFFDALHYCHTYERTDTQELGKIVFPDTQHTAGNTQPPHYRIVADRAHQVFDAASGDLCPAQGGEIRADGLFSEDDLAKAQQSTALASPQPNKQLLNLFKAPLEKAVTVAPPENFVPPKPFETIKSSDALYKAAEHGNTLVDVLRYYDGRNFAYHGNFSDYWTQVHERSAIACGWVTGVSGAIAIATAAPVYGLVSLAGVLLGGASAMVMRSGPTYEGILLKNSTGRNFQYVLGQFNEAADRIPDSCAEEKHLCQEFAKAADFAFHMEYAAAMAEKYAHHRHRDKKMRQYMPLVEHAAAIAQMSPEQTDALRQAYMDNRLERGSFRARVESRWNADICVPPILNTDPPETLQLAQKAKYRKQTNELGDVLWVPPEDYHGLRGRLALCALKFTPK